MRSWKFFLQMFHCAIVRKCHNFFDLTTVSVGTAKCPTAVWIGSADRSPGSHIPLKHPFKARGKAEVHEVLSLHNAKRRLNMRSVGRLLPDTCPADDTVVLHCCSFFKGLAGSSKAISDRIRSAAIHSHGEMCRFTRYFAFGEPLRRFRQVRFTRPTREC